MVQLLTPIEQYGGSLCPHLVEAAGPDARRRFIEFFTVTIRNKNTREAYARAVGQFFSWCEERNLALETVSPLAVASYIERHPASPPTVKLHLAAIRMLFDWLVTGNVLKSNPATSVKGPKHIVKKGKTPILTAEEAREFFQAIDVSNLNGLRDRALVSVMVYSFARVSAVVSMRVKDYYPHGKRWWLRLHEKGGKFHEVPAHHKVEEYVDAYLEASGIGTDKNAPLFQSFQGRSTKLSGFQLSRFDALAIVKRRAMRSGLSARFCNHSFRGTGITIYLKNGGLLENAQNIAGHESPRTTKLYDRRSDDISLDEIERIVF